MADFKVCFFNDLADSSGHDHHVCQRTIEVRDAVAEHDAIALAIREFERLEGVENWQLHARKLETSRLD